MTRDAYFSYRCGLCERCGEAGKIVHHKIHLTPENIHDPRVTLNFKNLELLCYDCHSKEHEAERLHREMKREHAAKSRYTVDRDGTIHPPGG